VVEIPATVEIGGAKEKETLIISRDKLKYVGHAMSLNVSGGNSNRVML
jgi:hypothetical protein